MPRVQLLDERSQSTSANLVSLLLVQLLLRMENPRYIQRLE
jgi:hypothetical protein